MSLRKALGTIGMFFIGGQIVLVAIFANVLILVVRSEATINSWLNFLVFGSLALIFMKMHGRQLVFDWRRKGTFFVFLGKVLLGWFSLLVMSTLANLVIFNLLGEDGIPGNQYAIESLAASYPILMVVTAVLFAPFVEEIVFRLAFMKALERWPWLGIIASSLVFGLLHVVMTGDFIFLISYAAMGLPLGYSYYKTGNIWFPMAIHFIQNLFAISMVLFS